MLASPLRHLVIVLLAVIAFAAACGGSDDEQATSDAESATTASVSDDTSDDTSSDPDDETDDAASGSDSGDAAQLSKPIVTDDLLGDYDALVTTDLVVGTGAEAVAGDRISMQYVGVLGSDGTEFDASWNRGAPFDFALGSGQVISGWDEGIVGMRVGGRRVLQIPSDMAYGASPRGDIIGADADLLFIVDLIGIAPPAPTPVPPEPAPPVDQAFLGKFDQLEVTDLVEGSGRASAEGDIIAVQYVGVLASDGAEFDSSWNRGATPLRLIVGRGGVIDGWNSGLVGMKVGGERVLQIPASQAYGDAGAGSLIGPGTDLVFRIHLEELIEAPLAHTLTFTAPSPSEVQATTLVAGDGPEASAEGSIDAGIVVYLHNDSQLVESTYTNGQTQTIDLAVDNFIPGVTESLVGMQAGEVRQVIVPTGVAFPDGVPADAGLGDDDSLVFIIEAVSVN